VKQLSLECDCVIVIGSETSSNSNRLKELAEKCGAQAWLVDSEENLEKSFF
jgi:4-hydroxy-3-methylbut-2-enyl diphosphate reductase